MALFPTLSDIPYVDYSGTSRQKILSSNFDDQGRTQKKKKWLFPKRDISLNYAQITDDNLTELLQFEIDRDGTFSMFTWIEAFSHTFENEYFGTGDGSTTVFDLPAKLSGSRTIYGDSSPYIEAPDSTGVGDFWVEQEAGANGLDRIEFFIAPLEGVRLTADFTGRLGVRCRFAGAILYQRLRYDSGFNTCSIELEGFHMDE